MASVRSSAALLCVCSLLVLLLVTDVAVAAQHQQTEVTGSTTKQFYLRGEVVSMLAENETSTAVENFDSFDRRELRSDYGDTSSQANCSGHCK